MTQQTQQTEQTQQHPYPDGAPCWADLNTPDLAGAQRFYAGLLGWSFDEADPEMGYYAMARKDGKTVAGIAPKQPDMDMPTVWSVYLKSGDVEDTARRITAAGGKLMMPPMDIADQGRMLFAFDPTGAAFGVWQPGEHRAGAGQALSAPKRSCTWPCRSCRSRARPRSSSPAGCRDTRRGCRPAR